MWWQQCSCIYGIIIWHLYQWISELDVHSRSCFVLFGGGLFLKSPYLGLLPMCLFSFFTVCVMMCKFLKDLIKNIFEKLMFSSAFWQAHICKKSNINHQYATIIASILLGRLSTRFWNMAAGNISDIGHWRCMLGDWLAPVHPKGVEFRSGSVQAIRFFHNWLRK